MTPWLVRELREEKEFRKESRRMMEVERTVLSLSGQKVVVVVGGGGHKKSIFIKGGQNVKKKQKLFRQMTCGPTSVNNLTGGD